MLFGAKKSPGKTVLILDVENGSVGSALVRLSDTGQPKLFGEARFNTPVGMSRSGAQIADDIEEAARQALRHASEVAARVRTHSAVSLLGEVDHAAVFLAPPWGRPDLTQGRPDFLPAMKDALSQSLQHSFGATPSSWYTGAGAAAFGARATAGSEPCLVCVVTGEVSELMRMDQDGVAAHATFPSGSHALLRTLRTHGGLSDHEARSAARLPFDASHLREPFGAAARHFAGEFKEAAEAMARSGDVRRIRVVANAPVADWFARALAADEGLAELFPHGGEVRALTPGQLSAHLAAHSGSPDTMLMLAALFVDSHF